MNANPFSIRHFFPITSDLSGSVPLVAIGQRHAQLHRKLFRHFPSGIRDRFPVGQPLPNEQSGVVDRKHGVLADRAAGDRHEQVVLTDSASHYASDRTVCLKRVHFLKS